MRVSSGYRQYIRPAYSSSSGWPNNIRAMSEAFLLILQIIFMAVDCCLFCCSIVGNSIVIYVISCDKKLKSKSNYHILSVATADLLIGVFGIPLGISAGLTGAPHDFHLCLMLHSSLLAVFAVSLFSLVAVSIDRCWAVCYPVTYHIKSTTTTKIIIACCWVLGIFFGSLPTLGWNRASFDNKCDYRVVTDLNNLMLVCAAIAFLSTLAIAVLYLLVYCEILKQSKRRQEIIANSMESTRQRQEIRAAHTLAIVVGTFIVLWSPGIISLFIISITGDRGFYHDILGLSAVFVHLNAAIDPIIYAYRMNNIREALNGFCSDSKRYDGNNNNSSVTITRQSTQSFKMSIT